MKAINSKRILIKIGSSCLAGPHGVNKDKIKELVDDFDYLRKKNKELIIVSSGAIASAAKELKVAKNAAIHTKQAASAIGQPLLMNAYHNELEKKQITLAQLLVTHQDLNRKLNYHNLEKCLSSLLDNKTLPIINENDSVSFDEITFGDNDHLAARIAIMMGVDLVIYLTQAEGIYLSDDELLEKSQSLDELNQIKKMKKSQQGSGGILSKIEAIKKLHEANIHSLVCSFETKNPIRHALDKKRGTWILADSTLKKTRQRKIISQSKSNTSIHIDRGAYQALQKNASLLPSGVKSVRGHFQRGDSILIQHAGKTIGYGIAEYSSKDCQAILGKKSKDIKNILGYHLSNVIIHKNYLVLGKDHVPQRKSPRGKKR